LELSPAAKLAWQQELEGIVVFANGESSVFPESVLPSIIALCADWRLAGSALDTARADQHTANLLDYLLESRCIYVE
jgi:50S ribosomal protein L16 3-hydroxylase